MRNTVVLLLLLFSFTLCYSQEFYRNVRIFAGVTADTVGSITSADSVEVQIDPAFPWILLTEVVEDTAMITGYDKVNEQPVLFRLAGESWWTQVPEMRFRIYSTNEDTVTSNWIRTGDLQGAITLHVKPDTVGSYTDYGNTLLTGN